jgi:hypothetical protein
MAELTHEDEVTLRRLIGEALQKPPMIGLVGVSGVGKSSTINTMFKTSLPISHTRPLSTKASTRLVDLSLPWGSHTAIRGSLDARPVLRRRVAIDDEHTRWENVSAGGASALSARGP